jgi:DNA-binding NarL/FixJ family response regulator
LFREEKVPVGGSLHQLKRRAATVFEECSSTMRTTIVLKLQAQCIRTLVREHEPFLRTSAVPEPSILPRNLTPREFAVLELVVQGKTTKEIAAELGISFKTAATHRYSAMGKMGVTNTAALVRDSIRMGIGQNQQWPRAK